MKVAVPTASDGGLDDKVGEHFGRTPTYTIVEVETGTFDVIPNTSHHTGGTGYPPEILHNTGVKVLLCRGLGKRAIQTFSSLGIEVYVGASGTVKDALGQYKAGSLLRASESDACTQHAFRNPLHDKGGCGKEHHGD